jgi:hypothetical protein
MDWLERTEGIHITIYVAIYGVLKIIDPSKEDKASVTSLVQEYQALDGVPSLPMRPTDWPKISKCREGSSILLSFQSPSQEGSIRFDRNGTSEGHYQYKILQKNLLEEGRIMSVRVVSEVEVSKKPFIELSGFPVRFDIRTSASSDRQKTERRWLIGISSFEQPPYESL